MGISSIIIIISIATITIIVTIIVTNITTIITIVTTTTAATTTTTTITITFITTSSIQCMLAQQVPIKPLSATAAFLDSAGLGFTCWLLVGKSLLQRILEKYIIVIYSNTL